MDGLQWKDRGGRLADMHVENRKFTAIFRWPRLPPRSLWPHLGLGLGFAIRQCYRRNIELHSYGTVD